MSVAAYVLAVLAIRLYIHSYLVCICSSSGCWQVITLSVVLPSFVRGLAWFVLSLSYRPVCLPNGSRAYMPWIDLVLALVSQLQPLALDMSSIWLVMPIWNHGLSCASRMVIRLQVGIDTRCLGLALCPTL